MTLASDRVPDRRHYDLTSADHDYRAWTGPPRRTILICTHPRSGSTLLGEALYFAGGLGCPLEYFHIGFRPTLAARWDAHSLDAYLRAVTRNRTDPGGVLAVKLFWRDVAELALERDPVRFAELETAGAESVSPETYRGIADMLTEMFPAPQIIHLERLDRVRNAVSGVIADQTRAWRSIPDHGPLPTVEPRFDFARIDQLVGVSDAFHRHWRNLFAVMDEEPHRLTYEELVGDYAGSVGAVLACLGSDASPPPPRMLRQADALSEAFVLRYLREREAR